MYLTGVTKMSQQTDFINTIAPHAQKSQKKTGIPASVTIAQAILESGWGRSSLTKEANNFFGIKAGRSWKGKVYSGTTWEVFNGKTQKFYGTGFVYVNKEAAIAKGVHKETLFRYYDSLEDCLTDKSKVLYNGLYNDALSWRSNSREFLKRMAPVYATDPEYGNKLNSIIDRYKLTQYDVHPKDWRLDTSIVPDPWYSYWYDCYRQYLV